MGETKRKFNAIKSSAALMVLLSSLHGWASDDNGVTACLLSPFIFEVIHLVHGDSNLGEFVLKYEKVRAPRGSSPTVIFIPGGPGDSSIGRKDIPTFIPENFGVIMTDPRGAGCNLTRNQMSEDDYNSEIFASDILAIVKNENLKPSDTVLYGHSNGTITAVLAAYQNQQSGGEPFSKIVLEGAFYKTFGPQEYLKHYETVFKRYMSSPGAIKASEIETLMTKYNVDRYRMAQMIRVALDHLGENDKLHIEGGPNPLLKAGVMAPYDFRLARQVWCREMSDETDGDKRQVYEAGELHVEHTGTKRLCGDLSPDRAFDASRFQLRENLVYLEGEEDASTPIDLALEHFGTQRAAVRKTFVSFPGFGHMPLTGLELKRPGFVKALWEHGFDGQYVKKRALTLKVGLSVKE